MGSAPLSLVYERRHLSRAQEGDAYVVVDQNVLLADLDGNTSISSERMRSHVEALSQTLRPSRFDKSSFDKTS